MAELATVATIAALAGTAITAYGTVRSGQAANAAAQFQATQLEQQAKEEKAAAQRGVLDQRKKTNFLLSRQQAVAAGSGFSASDPTVSNLAGGIAQEGEYQAGMITYGAEQRARGLNLEAASARATGRAQQTGSYLSAAGQIASGIGNAFFMKYGGGMPGAGGASAGGGSYLAPDYAGLT